MAERGYPASERGKRGTWNPEVARPTIEEIRAGAPGTDRIDFVVNGRPELDGINCDAGPSGLDDALKGEHIGVGVIDPVTGK